MRTNLDFVAILWDRNKRCSFHRRHVRDLFNLYASCEYYATVRFCQENCEDTGILYYMQTKPPWQIGIHGETKKLTL